MRVLWFVLLLPFVAMAAQKQNSCIGKNSFLESMSKAKPVPVTIFGTPTTPEKDHCGSEWKEHNTCCKFGSLENFLELEKNLIRNNANYLKTQATELSKEVAKLDLVVYPSRNLTIELLDNFTKSSDICWNKMKAIRSSAVCAICSGRSELYFSQDKILISPETCRDMTNNCHDFFTFLSKIVKQMPELNTTFQLNTTTYLKAIHLMEDLKKYAPPQELIAAFAEFDGHQNDPVKYGIHSAKVCSMVLNVRKPPYILIMNDHGAKAVSKATKEQIEIEEKIRKEEIKAKFELERTRIENNIARDTEAIMKAYNETIKKIEAEASKSTPAKVQEAKDKALKELEHDLAKKNKEAASLRSENDRKHFGKSEVVENDFKGKQTAAQANIAQEKSNWKQEQNLRKQNAARLLFTGGVAPENQSATNSLIQPQSSVFESDSLVLIKATDSMFSAFEGAKGTALATENSPLRAMNLSLTFP